MAASVLDPHVLVRSDSKSAPRPRSFRERAEVRHLCVYDACTLDALVHLHLIMSRLPHDSYALISQDHVDSDASTASRTAPDALTRRNKDDCLRAPHARAHVIVQLAPPRSFRDFRQQSDFLKVSRNDLLVAARAPQVEGKTNGDPR